MERFVEDHDSKAGDPMQARSASTGTPGRPEKFSNFRKILAQIADHPSDKYFILKSIIISNLFGVDIMEEAVEICKLRLFLKLVAQVETADQIEPLPDIDFNIRADNTLVGYVSLDQVRKSQEGTLDFGAKELQRIEEDVLAVEKCFEQFRAHSRPAMLGRWSVTIAILPPTKHTFQVLTKRSRRLREIATQLPWPKNV
jgi:hypothetical protein